MFWIWGYDELLSLLNAFSLNVTQKEYFSLNIQYNDSLILDVKMLLYLFVLNSFITCKCVLLLILIIVQPRGPLREATTCEGLDSKIKNP